MVLVLSLIHILFEEVACWNRVLGSGWDVAAAAEYVEDAGFETADAGLKSTIMRFTLGILLRSSTPVAITVMVASSAVVASYVAPVSYTHLDVYKRQTF